MHEQIEVELKTGGSCHMSPAALDYFLALALVGRFKRDDVWIVVGRDSLRAMKIRGHYPLSPWRHKGLGPNAFPEPAVVAGCPLDIRVRPSR
jgi:hypothetical protein